MKFEAVSGEEIREPLRLLENSLRAGESLSEEFVSRMRRSVEMGGIEVLVARKDGRSIGVLVLAFRPSISLGGLFASIEDLYVEPGSRRRGAGRKLLETVAERCRRRGVSYVEVHAEEDEAMAFYAKLGYEKENGVRVFSRSYPLCDGELREE
ncbi:MAG: GNAT family N-acetyltransferase [Actinomycetota bacterium]|nr:GNAT family N-acetyltransferase [Rubrobacter sp.]MDQ3506747.1 GNAT family N-acetyltransferase [Actinomycetota bacterium]